MADAHAHAAHQFGDVSQQRDAVTLGMWLFLVTEIMFFGAIFTGYGYHRYRYAEPFVTASQYLDVKIGAINTAILIGSSFSMALAVRAGRLGQRRGTAALLAVTIVLGCAFLGLKGYEYYEKAMHHHVPGAGFAFTSPDRDQIQLFFVFYFVMTGTHALHMVIGIGVLAVLAMMSWRGRFSPAYNTPVDMAGLYWHFVDIVWIFLFPMLYLVGRH